ncbi:hypothetical protein [Acinetobacter sp. NyZ410]|uniref:hypothetical protein n=1 Tax=Acinetobacter sp. NyZ410 TaxID=2929509 RepID=UPI001FBB3F78|nr:hypothetical protein [Acinetobacter sp. NyZ410]UOH16900.1 hypothetical protein MTO68_13800 [Acinetobacter sp. NyZ410]
MTLKDSVQTAILVVGMFSLFVFGASYYFVLIDPDSSNYPLKEALSITASFFGGFATLTAAFIASKLFNDWKDQHNKQIINNFGLQVYENFTEFEKKLSIHQQYLQQLDEIIENYDYPVNKITLQTDNNMQYLNNIINSIGEIKIVFNSLYSQFQAYSIASGNLSIKYLTYNDYLLQFNEIYLLNDDIYYLDENLKDWYEMQSEAIGLANTLRNNEIEPIIKNLKVE